MIKHPVVQPLIAMYFFKKPNSVKSYYLLAVAITAMFFSGCQKAGLSDPAATAGASVDADIRIPFFGRNAGTKYGALIGAPDDADDFSFQLGVAKQLGISCLRESVTVPSQAADSDLVPELYTKYKILLNFTSPSRGKRLTPFRTDLTQYKKDLNDILATFTVNPVVAVIENEESNMFYYSGSTQDYINQLSAAIDVMHSHNIKVTNGGITKVGLNYLVYEDFVSQGKTDSAANFALLAGVYPDSPMTQNRGRYIDTLLQAYKTMKLDYVNFHWKDSITNPEPLHEAINYLKKATHKKIITNELGQFDTDPNTLLTHVQECSDQKFPYMIWYSPDQGKGKRGRSLQYSDGTLTPSGYAYQGYLAK